MAKYVTRRSVETLAHELGMIAIPGPCDATRGVWKIVNPYIAGSDVSDGSFYGTADRAVGVYRFRSTREAYAFLEGLRDGRKRAR